MAYLCVNKNGDEIISEGLPKRNTRYETWEYWTSVNHEDVDFTIYLKNGTIEKVIGRKLTWEDNPVNID